MVQFWGRKHLTAHPRARHTWAQQLKEPDSEYFDGLPYRSSDPGSFHSPTGKPRHRAWQVGDRAAFSNLLVEGKEFPSGDVLIMAMPTPGHNTFTVRYVSDPSTRNTFFVQLDELGTAV